MIQKNKRVLILLAAGSLLSLLILASGISQMVFTPSTFFRLNRELPEFELLSELTGPDVMLLLERYGMIVPLLCFPVSIIVMLVSPEVRKHVLRMLLSLMWIIMLYFVYQSIGSVIQNNMENLQQTNLTPAPPSDLAPYVEVPSTPEWFVYLIGFLIVAFLFIFSWIIYNRYLKPSTLVRIGQEAKETLAEIQSGANIKDAIIRCYYEMNRTIQTHRGVKREKERTPREFEEQLHEAGLPKHHVKMLTRLFEQVRYGAKTASKEEETQAISCLTAIIQYVEGAG